MLPRGSAAARAFPVVLLVLFLMTSPAFAAPWSEEIDFSRVASYWSELLHRVSGLWASEVLPSPGGTSGGGGSGTSLDPSGLRRPVG